MFGYVIRILTFGCVFFIAACATDKPSPYLIFNFEDARVSVFAVRTDNLPSFRGVMFEGDQPGALTGKSAVIKGVGSIAIGDNRIKFSRNEVYVNDKRVRADGRAYANYILYPDGRLEEGFIRSFK